MKRISMLLAAGIVVLVSACASIPQQTPAQIAAVICPNIQTELTTLQEAGVFTGGAQVTLSTKVQPDVALVCGAGVTVTTVSLTNLASTTFPVVIALIGSSNLTQQDKTIAILAVGAIQSSINTAISLQGAPIVMPPASTPIPASPPLVA
jgi:hypothetical protein